MMMLIHNDDQSALSASSSGKEKYLHNEAVFNQWKKSQAMRKKSPELKVLYTLSKFIPSTYSQRSSMTALVGQMLLVRDDVSNRSTKDGITWKKKKSSMIKTPVKQRTNPSKLKAGADGEQVKNKSRTNLFFLCPYYSLRHVDGKSHAASMAS